MTARPVDPRVLPPAIADDRGRAVLSLMAEIAGRFDWRRDLAVTWADVPSAMLPYAIRSLALQDFVQPGMTETVLRRFVANAWQIHQLKGKVAGVRFGLSLLGMSVEWRQWFLDSPPGPPGTYVATVRLSDEVFEAEGRAITLRAQRAAIKMIDVTKRWSQDGSLRVSTEGESEAPIRIGAVVRQLIRVRPTVDPITTLVAAPPAFVGAVVRNRIRVRPGA